MTSLLRRAGLVLAVILGLYLVARAVAEPFVIDFADPATYRLDWGGPSLPGVLLVHCGPGVVAATLMVRGVRRRLRTRRPAATVHSGP
jgi:hypothetical protein